MRMETKIATVALSAALFVPMLLGGAMMNNSAIASAEDGIMTISHTVEEPTVGDPVQYNCVVAYPIIQNDDHCDRVYCKQSESDDEDATTSFFLTYHEEEDSSGSTASDNVRYYIVPAATNSLVCTPDAKVCHAYCSDCGQYSSYCTSLSSANKKANYSITGKTGSIAVISSSGLKFKHTSDSASFYRYSLAYKGTVQDGKASTSGGVTKFTIDGITFTIRADSTGITVSATTRVECNCYDTMFVYQLMS